MSATEEYKSLSRKRAVVKSQLTNFKKFIVKIQEFLASGENNELTEVDCIALEQKIKQCEIWHVDFKNLQDEIDLIVTDEQFDEQIKFRSEFEEALCQNLALAKTLRPKNQVSANVNNINASGVESASGSQRGTPSHTSDDDNQTISSVEQDSFIRAIKLPDINLPKFDGSNDAWLEFRDFFQSLIHDNEKLPPIQKFHYLKLCLMGQAHQVTRAIKLEASNYQVAWKALCDRYNNSEVLIQSHVKSLFNLKVITFATSQTIRNLIDSLNQHTEALKALDQPTEHWGTLLIYIIANKLDNETRKEWERLKSKISNVTLDKLIEFLKSRSNILETIEFTQSDAKPRFQAREKTQRTLLSSNGLSCYVCKENHFIYNCDKFKSLNPSARLEKVKTLKLCENCLKPGHPIQICKFGPCRKCNLKHNSLLHVEQSTVANREQRTVANSNITSISAFSSVNKNQVLLATVSIWVFDANNQPYKIRAIMDCGSQSNIVSEECCRFLKLKTNKLNMSVVGIGGSVSNVSEMCDVQAQSSCSHFRATFSCVVLSEIPGHYPNFEISDKLQIPTEIELADPEFYAPNKVDMLIGNEMFWELLGTNQIKLGKSKPILQETKFGWIVTGALSRGHSGRSVCNLLANQNLSLDANIQKDLTKFWEIEEISYNQPMSKEQIECEAHYALNTVRNQDGRFIVSMPIKGSLHDLGESESTAVKQFLSLERRLVKEPNVYQRYIKFMTEYESLGDMSKVTSIDDTSKTYYLPHHGVLKPESESTKLRVVFNASSKTSTGFSLNDLQMVGPIIQEDLVSILTNFRKHPYVIMADVERMYRQVLVNPEQRNLQRIIWRKDPSEPIQIYKLNTVTYGTAAAPYLAIRSLSQLANDCKPEHPIISKIICKNFYVDDLITGAESIEEAATICKNLDSILKQGCFVLKKWASNNPSVLRHIPREDWSSANLQFDSDTNTVKTLGLMWNCKRDQLRYKINFDNSPPYTKRSMLSVIARIFDPLGLLGPCIIVAKIMLQQLWLQNLSWNDVLTHDLAIAWTKFCNEISLLNDLNVPRHVICNDPILIELHGFSDASESAYGACVYIKSTNSMGDSQVNLLCAKSKVAPIKRLTIPRLELLGALTLARLVKKVIQATELPFKSVVLWCDSTIVLGWIRTSPNLLQVFVGARISEIIELTNEATWRHVPTASNPADLVSRGVSPSLLSESCLWWSGPSWLKNDESTWPISKSSSAALPELREASRPVLASIKIESNTIFTKFSSFSKLQRVTAFCFRFFNNIRAGKENRKVGPLSYSELQFSTKKLILVAQLESFDKYYQKSLIRLAPWKDKEGIIRVGGRLQASNLALDKVHPPILPKKHPLTKLFLQHEHIRLLHAGPQTLLSSVRDRIWPLSGRSLARTVVHDCVKCFRARPSHNNPFMGNLPQHRVHCSLPFATTGVDYAGPLQLKDKKGRGGKITKCYICLFVCFTSRAIHLELVTELTTDAFIMALRRFVSRRGLPSQIYSDNGTNFVGAKSELKELGKFLINHESSITEALGATSINWHFNPPHAPNFGGLWEAGVRSTKHHLKRVASNAHLTFEEMYTLLTQVESILNSRPISPLSSDINDLSPLTPGHFLIGQPLTSVPDPDYTHIPERRLTRYKRIQQLRQQFWNRWHKDYLSELQVRSKWFNKPPNIKIGDVVIVREDNIPPMQWPLARVIEVHPGKDEVVRVATIKTKRGTFKRPANRLCLLPTETTEVDDT